MIASEHKYHPAGFKMFSIVIGYNHCIPSGLKPKRKIEFLQENRLGVKPVVAVTGKIKANKNKKII